MYEVNVRIGAGKWEPVECVDARAIVTRALYLGWGPDGTRDVRISGGGAACLSVVFPLEPHGGQGWLTVVADGEEGPALLRAIREEKGEIIEAGGCLFCGIPSCEADCENEDEKISADFQGMPE